MVWDSLGHAVSPCQVQGGNECHKWHGIPKCSFEELLEGSVACPRWTPYAVKEFGGCRDIL